MPSDLDYLHTIIRSGFQIRNYVGPLTVKEFRDLHHAMHRDAVLWRFRIVADAACHISDQLKTAHPEIPWRRLEDYRDFIDDDHRADFHKLWQIGIQGLPTLIPRLAIIVPPEQPDERL